MSKTILVTGAGGFIGTYLVSKLVDEGNFVVGVDLKYPEYCDTAAQQFMLFDLRYSKNVSTVLLAYDYDEVYALAADMGGMGFISTAECEIMRNNALINMSTLHAAALARVPRYFFSSSVCVYRDMLENEKQLTETDAIPANPDNEYGWEKLYAERVALAYSRKYPIEVRIARFENCYGPLGAWRGGREKAPAAICRKVAEAKDNGMIDVWGDGKAIRVFTYVSDLVEGIVALMRSDEKEPTNIGCDERVTVEQLVEMVIGISGKRIGINYVSGPVGVHSRNFSKARIRSLGWQPSISLEEGLMRTYVWIQSQVEKAEDNNA